MKNGMVDKDNFKIVYVAPMKALAAEMTATFGKRLASLGKCSPQAIQMILEFQALQSQLMVSAITKILFSLASPRIYGKASSAKEESRLYGSCLQRS